MFVFPVASGEFSINWTPGGQQQRDYSKWGSTAAARLTNGGFVREFEAFMRIVPLPLYEHTESLGTYPAFCNQLATKTLTRPAGVKIGGSSDPASRLLGRQLTGTGFNLYLDSPLYYENTRAMQFPPNTPNATSPIVATMRSISASGAAPAPWLQMMLKESLSSTGPGQRNYWSGQGAEMRLYDPEIDTSYGNGTLCATSWVGSAPLTYLSNGDIAPLTPLQDEELVPGASTTYMDKDVGPMYSSGYTNPSGPLYGKILSSTIQAKQQPLVPKTQRVLFGNPGIISTTSPQQTSTTTPQTVPDSNTAYVGESQSVSWSPLTNEQKYRGVIIAPAMAHAAASSTAIAYATSFIKAKYWDKKGTNTRTQLDCPRARPTCAASVNFAGPTELTFCEAKYPLRERGVVLYTRVGCDLGRPLVEMVPGSNPQVGVKVPASEFMAVEVMSNTVFLPLVTPVGPRSGTSASHVNGYDYWTRAKPADPFTLEAFNPYSLVPSTDLSSMFWTADPSLEPAAIIAHSKGEINGYFEATPTSSIATPLVEVSNPHSLTTSSTKSLFKQPIHLLQKLPNYGGHSYATSFFFEYQLGSLYIPPHLGLLFVDAKGRLFGKQGPLSGTTGKLTIDMINGAWYAEDAPAADGAFAALDQFFLSQFDSPPITVKVPDLTNTTLVNGIVGPSSNSYGSTYDPRYATGFFVFERVDATFITDYGLTPVDQILNFAMSLDVVNQLPPVNASTNYTRVQTGVFDYFREGVRLFPESLLDGNVKSGPQCAAALKLATGGIVRRKPSTTWLVVMLSYISAYRYPPATLPKPGTVDNVQLMYPTSFSTFERQARYIGASVNFGGLQALPNGFGGKTCADLFMEHYTTGYLATFYGSGKAPDYIPEIPFDLSCQCIQYMAGAFNDVACPTTLLNAMLANPNGPVFLCSIAGSSLICYDTHCTGVPNPYFYAHYNKDGYCTKKQVDIGVSSVVCANINLISQGNNSIAVISDSVQQQCNTQKESFTDASTYCAMIKPTPAPTPAPKPSSPAVGVLYPGRLFTFQGKYQSYRPARSAVYTETAAASIVDLSGQKLYKSADLVPLKASDLYDEVGPDISFAELNGSDVWTMAWSEATTGAATASGFKKVTGSVTDYSGYQGCTGAYLVPFLILQSSGKVLATMSSGDDLAPLANKILIVAGQTAYKTDGKGTILGQQPCNRPALVPFTVTPTGVVYGDAASFCEVSTFYKTSTGGKLVDVPEITLAGSNNVATLDVATGMVLKSCSSSSTWLWLAIILIVFIILAFIVVYITYRSKLVPQTP
jgi:hypothetical protein